MKKQGAKTDDAERERRITAMMRVEISREKWLRGEGHDGSQLLRKSDKKMCCLGFVCLALGATREQIMDVGLPSRVSSVKLPQWMRRSSDVLKAVSINDAIDMDDATRERHITEIFACHRLQAVFVD